MMNGRKPLAALLGAWIISTSALAVDLDDVLHGVAVVESSDRDLGLHPDGVTYGRYGVTYMAVAELRRLHVLGDEDIDLLDPATNRSVAKHYLLYLKRRYGSWWKAVQKYNPRSKSYARRVWSAMDRQRQSAKR